MSSREYSEDNPGVTCNTTWSASPRGIERLFDPPSRCHRSTAPPFSSSPSTMPQASLADFGRPHICTFLPTRRSLLPPHRFRFFLSFLRDLHTSKCTITPQAVGRSTHAGMLKARCWLAGCYVFQSRAFVCIRTRASELAGCTPTSAPRIQPNITSLLSKVCVFVP